MSLMAEGLDGTCLNEAGSCQFGVNQADSQQHAPKYNSCSLEDYHRRVQLMRIYTSLR